MPWLTGGLAGALFTFLVNQRMAKRKQARATVKTEKSDYSLIVSDPQLKDIRVSYKGSEYDKISFFQIAVENTSTKTISNASFLLNFESGAKIVDVTSECLPIDRKMNWSLAQAGGKHDVYEWEIGDLRPNDSAKIRMIVSPSPPVEWKWRGGDDVEVISAGQVNEKTLERDIKNILLWIAAYIAFSRVFQDTEVAQSVFIIATMPIVVPNIIRWISIFAKRRKSERSIVSINGNSNVVSIRGVDVDRQSTTEGVGTPAEEAKR